MTVGWMTNSILGGVRDGVHTLGNTGDGGLGCCKWSLITRGLGSMATRSAARRRSAAQPQRNLSPCALPQGTKRGCCDDRRQRYVAGGGGIYRRYTTSTGKGGCIGVMSVRVVDGAVGAAFSLKMYPYWSSSLSGVVPPGKTESPSYG